MHPAVVPVSRAAAGERATSDESSQQDAALAIQEAEHAHFGKGAGYRKCGADIAESASGAATGGHFPWKIQPREVYAIAAGVQAGFDAWQQFRFGLFV